MDYEIILFNKKASSKNEAMNMIKHYQNQLNNNNATIGVRTLSKIAKAVTSGHSFNVGLVKEKRLMAFDLDNPESVSLNYLTLKLRQFDLCPAIVYETMSSTDENPRWRFIYILSEPITSNELYEEAAKAVICKINSVFSNMVDSKCSNVNRVFFPGKNLTTLDKNKILNLSKVLSKDSSNDKEVAKDEYENIDIGAICLHVLKDMDMISAKEFKKQISRNRNVFAIKNEGPKTQYNINSTMTEKNISKISVRFKVYIRGTSPEGKSLQNLYTQIPVLERVRKSKHMVSDRHLFQHLDKILKKEHNIFFNDIFSEQDEYGNNLRAIITKDNKTNKILYSRYAAGRFYDSMDAFNVLQKIFGLKTMKEVRRFISFNSNLKQVKADEVDPNINNFIKRLGKDFLNLKYLNEVFERDDNKTKTVLKFILKKFVKQRKETKCKKVNSQMVLNLGCLSKDIEDKTGVKISNINNKIHTLNNLGLIHEIKPENYNLSTDNLIKKLKDKTFKSFIVIEVPWYSAELLKIADEKAVSVLKINLRNSYAENNAINSDDYLLCKEICQSKINSQKYCYISTLKQAIGRLNGRISDDAIKKRFTRIYKPLLESGNYIEIIATKENAKKYNLRDGEYRQGISKLIVNAS